MQGTIAVRVVALPSDLDFPSAVRDAMLRLRNFRSKRYENIVAVYVEFEKDSEPEAFKARFKAQEGRPESDVLSLLLNEWLSLLRFHDDDFAKDKGTTEEVRGWRLKADEVRTQAEGFSSADAGDTMNTVAETWNHIAEDLERRLAGIVSRENKAEQAIEAQRPALPDR